ncbi:MAG: hypothetical protein NCW75_04815 [Phycisphaera sp.]|nr:MAG: hypothetical protein NCW75_04815 [Phycisphaera sp.]
MGLGTARSCPRGRSPPSTLPSPHNPTGPAASLLNDGTVDVGQADENNGFFDASVPTGVRSIDFRARMRLSNGQTSDWSETATIRFDTA